jgi:hypothetical protein
MKIRFTVGEYFFWFLAVPLTIMIPLFAGLSIGHNKVVMDNPIFQILQVVLGLPVLINLFLGPSIYSYWKKKKSRSRIAFLNIFLLMCGGMPGLLIWIWALLGETE